ncbi:cation diffusion facilitator family transporter [Halotalea alkalilenta]|uniref:cation diffusion facilitator family transporter n=1 Tax=Halotalea alkalilenta TaxID=376489 RepID=UPI000482DA08|nr:cation diffusion facilitator family transporter [Halotalea alkalilenta]
MASLEQRLLKQSTLMMALVAVCGIFFGLFAASQSILFDGIFSVVATLIKILMLVTARLIARESSRRFQFGYWHLEPIAMLVEGGFLLLIAVYAMSSGILGLLSGGHAIDFGLASIYAALFTLIDFGYYAYLRRRNRRLNSPLVRFDTLSWMTDGILSLGLLCAFVCAWILADTGYRALTPYLDPLILVVISLIIAPTALRASMPAFKDLLQMVPSSLDQQVRETMQAFVARHGLAGFTSYVQRSGRARFIEIHVLLAENAEIGTIARLDGWREEIANALGEAAPERWLTISFTSDPRWAQ